MRAAIHAELTWARRIFFFIGTLGVLGGIGVAVYAVFVLRPAIASLTGELRTATRKAERVVTVGGRDLGLVSQSVATMRSGERLLAGLPTTLHQLSEVLVQASNASVSAGNTAEKTKEGVAGIVLPKKQVGESGTALRGTGRQMRPLAQDLSRLGAASTALAVEVGALRRDLAAIPPQLGGNDGLIDGTRTELRAIDQALGRSDVPTQTMLLALTLGALFELLGFLSLGLGVALSHPAVASLGAARPGTQGTQHAA